MGTPNALGRRWTWRVRTVIGTIAVVTSIGVGAAAAGQTDHAHGLGSDGDPTGLGIAFSADIAEALDAPRGATDPTGLGVVFSAEIAEALERTAG